MPPTLFLVHGMGRSTPDWAAESVQQIVALPARYGYRWFEQNGAVDAHVAFAPIEYDDVFDRYVQAWGKSAGELHAEATKFGVDLGPIVTWLEGAGETEHNFFWTHVVDVVLYRFFSIVTAEVRARVRDAIAATITEAKSDGQLDATSVLAHSLGTAVTHDALALLGTQPIPTPSGPNASFLVGNYAFANLFMVANVSRVLETQPKVYESVVRPPGAGPSYVDAYYSFRHQLDPFAAVRPFAPVGWGDRYVAPDGVAKVLDFNVHALAHYLDDPRVHVPVLRSLVGRWAVSDAELAAAVAAHDARPEPPCLGDVLRFRSTAQRIIALASTGGDAHALVVAGTQFLAAAQEARDACV